MLTPNLPEPGTVFFLGTAFVAAAAAAKLWTRRRKLVATTVSLVSFGRRRLESALAIAHRAALHPGGRDGTPASSHA